MNRFYYPTKYKSRKEVISLGIKCVFISHQQKDKDEARIIADYLEKSGIDVYFDEYDSSLKLHHQRNDPQKVTESICNGINNSSHMLVIVSPNTISSSWVPFEIGYGFEKTDLAILCLKGIPKGSLPEYLRTAPVVRDIYDLNNKIASITGKSKERLIESNLLKAHGEVSNPLMKIMDSIIVD